MTTIAKHLASDRKNEGAFKTFLRNRGYSADKILAAHEQAVAASQHGRLRARIGHVLRARRALSTFDLANALDDWASSQMWHDAPMEHHFTHSGDFVIHWVQAGDPAQPGLVVIPGGVQNTAFWSEILLDLANDYHVVSLDLVGRGLSDWLPEGVAYRTATFADNVDSVTRVAGLQRFHLVGHSLGAHTAQFLASRRPQSIESLLINDFPPAKPDFLASRLEIRKDQAQNTYDTFESAVEAFAAHNDRYTKTVAGNSVGQMANGRWCYLYDPETLPNWDAEDMWEAVSSISSPTTITRGTELGRGIIMTDEVVHRMLSIYPRASFVELPGVGHDAPGEDSNQFMGVIRKAISLSNDSL